jgi:hypothetical protein
MAKIVDLMARLTCQNTQSLQCVRQDTGFLLHMQTGEPGLVPMLFKASQLWRAQLEEEKAPVLPLRAVLWQCINRNQDSTPGHMRRRALGNSHRMKPATQPPWEEPLWSANAPPHTSMRAPHRGTPTARWKTSWMWRIL